jgi:LysR family transcriptional regulator, glycine cleavage system transcriptional activator
MRTTKLAIGRKTKRALPRRTPAVRKLPPLNALRAFEAAARLGSFAHAAAELGVTAGAVSQQVKKLEDFFGRQLFIRGKNSLPLTDVGHSVYAAGTEMIDALRAMTQGLVDGNERRNLIVSVLPSVGVHWLNRKLPLFLREHPDLRVDLRLEDDPVDFFRTRIDVRISYGEHIYPEFVTVPIVRDRVTVMCTPAFAAEHQLARGDPALLRDEDLIHICWRTGLAAYPTWNSWFEAAGAPRQARRELGHTTDLSSLAIDLARSGAGAVLAQRWLAQEELRAGTLITPFKTTLDLQYRYCAVHLRGNARNQAVTSFVEWLCAHGAQV